MNFEPLPSDIIAAGMDLIGKSGWNAFHPFSLLSETGWNGQKYGIETREDFLKAVLLTIEKQTLEQSGNLDDGSLSFHERLFEVFMCRFEIMLPFRPSLGDIWAQWSQNPGSILDIAPSWKDTILRLFTHAASPVESGNTSCLRQSAFIFFYIKAQEVWMSDDTNDLSRTLAALDEQISLFLEIFYQDY